MTAVTFALARLDLAAGADGYGQFFVVFVQQGDAPKTPESSPGPQAAADSNACSHFYTEVEFEGSVEMAHHQYNFHKRVSILYFFFFLSVPVFCSEFPTRVHLPLSDRREKYFRSGPRRDLASGVHTCGSAMASRWRWSQVLLI